VISKVLPGLRDRTVSIRAAMETAKKASEDANARLAAIEGRLAKLDTEVAGLKTQAENDFKAEEQRIREQAEQDAARVVQMAEQEIATAAKTARRELKVFAADLAVSLAEKRITVDRDTDEQIVHTFVNQLTKDGK
jgi:F-type H+-transporting ATPase subunit b